MAWLKYLDPKGKTIGTLRLAPNGGVEATGVGNDALDLWVCVPAVDGQPVRQLTRKDGPLWLDGVRWCYRNGYVRVLWMPEEPTRKSNPYHVPAGSPDGGQFTSGEGGAATSGSVVPDVPKGTAFRNDAKAPILDGVDPEANVQRLRDDLSVILEDQIGKVTTVAPDGLHALAVERVQTELATLRDLPLIHATTPEVAARIWTDGELLSRTGLDRREAVALARLGELRVKTRGPDPSATAPGKSALTPEESAEYDRLLPLATAGSTNNMDRNAGLDRFVFASHGVSGSQYGTVQIALDNSLIDDVPGAFVTSHDIMQVAGRRMGEATDGSQDTYEPEGVVKYQREVLHAGGYWQVAAIHAAEIHARMPGERIIAEVKIPERVDRSRILGFYSADVWDREYLIGHGVPESMVFASAETRIHQSPESLPGPIRDAQRARVHRDDGVATRHARERIARDLVTVQLLNLLDRVEGRLRRQKYNKDHPMRLPPIDQTLGQQNYVIVLADDAIGSRTGVPSCPVCNYLADVGSFDLADALQQIDQMLEGADQGLDPAQLDDLAPFPVLDEIEGRGVKELTALGVVMPPFHPNCRCGIAVV